MANTWESKCTAKCGIVNFHIGHEWIWHDMAIMGQSWVAYRKSTIVPQVLRFDTHFWTNRSVAIKWPKLGYKLAIASEQTHPPAHVHSPASVSSSWTLGVVRQLPTWLCLTLWTSCVNWKFSTLCVYSVCIYLWSFFSMDMDP